MTKTVNRAWIFDVDGVITDPADKRVKEEGLIGKIAERLDRGDVVTLNTGRSLSWLEDKGIFQGLESSIKDKGKLSNSMAVGEKGRTWQTYENGGWATHVDESIKVPESLQKEIRELIERDFSDSMFFDESKLTMISTEMIDGYSIPAYHDRQKELVERMRKVLKKPEYQGFELQIDPTTIATDIQNAHVGKHLGARRIVDWMEQKGISPEQIIAIGDSQSDTEMAEELQDEYSVKFVFVGDPNKLDKSRLHCPVTITQNRFGEGTLEYIDSIAA